MAITVAVKVLIVGGVLNLAYGTLLGNPITVIRAKGAPATPKYLMAGHISALLQAAVLLGLGAWDGSRCHAPVGAQNGGSRAPHPALPSPSVT
jgi:hypothetical protein